MRRSSHIVTLHRYVDMGNSWLLDEKGLKMQKSFQVSASSLSSCLGHSKLNAHAHIQKHTVYMNKLGRFFKELLKIEGPIDSDRCV